eukprot:COSAG06_NODE_5079_length_3736_cov_3.059033_2_plen_130_part_00
MSARAVWGVCWSATWCLAAASVRHCVVAVLAAVAAAWHIFVLALCAYCWCWYNYCCLLLLVQLLLLPPPPLLPLLLLLLRVLLLLSPACFRWLCSALPLPSNMIGPHSATLLQLSSAAVLSQLSSVLWH